MIFFALALGVWGVIAYLRGLGVSNNYRGALMIGELLVIGQALVGVTLVIVGYWPPDVLHFLYGIVIALMWVMTYIYTKGAMTRREILIYALVSFFIMGLAVRGIMTGSFNPSCLAAF
ncbi:MAG: hypothetical protein B6D41_07390 [Chloroflexi bacterium UTCFX4]|nr:MAG: hypothetical protein B6D41_07390 [Chloroflexi bacterium UTCFX4]